mmetsp:Transcript_16874/g.64049  ORF Transcript_16874/g.64049 Transcript_16874/m.64049 type:complete len:555 (+) Transcript_16874:1480-3144(+)
MAGPFGERVGSGCIVRPRSARCRVRRERRRWVVGVHGFEQPPVRLHGLRRLPALGSRDTRTGAGAPRCADRKLERGRAVLVAVGAGECGTAPMQAGGHVTEARGPVGEKLSQAHVADFGHPVAKVRALRGVGVAGDETFGRGRRRQVGAAPARSLRCEGGGLAGRSRPAQGRRVPVEPAARPRRRHRAVDEQDVVRLHVAVYDLRAMQLREAIHDLSEKGARGGRHKRHSGQACAVRSPTRRPARSRSKADLLELCRAGLPGPERLHNSAAQREIAALEHEVDEAGASDAVVVLHHVGQVVGPDEELHLVLGSRLEGLLHHALHGNGPALEHSVEHVRPLAALAEALLAHKQIGRDFLVLLAVDDAGGRRAKAPSGAWILGEARVGGLRAHGGERELAPRGSGAERRRGQVAWRLSRAASQARREKGENGRAEEQHAHEKQDGSAAVERGEATKLDGHGIGVERGPSPGRTPFTEPRAQRPVPGRGGAARGQGAHGGGLDRKPAPRDGEGPHRAAQLREARVQVRVHAAEGAVAHAAARHGPAVRSNGRQGRAA